ncbi:uncharacterized protein LOC120084053 [Benincasa hispida]|uniref:uncharacterized protein LOC120084053 n=1 Tax=Benincasa hispida TaxID=102211 RepID=UPI0018FFCF07|nr:uncharacterized protein LOC120084053 [Benincasa hispida]
MEWKNYYLDVILVSSGLLLTFVYHTWLWYKVKTQPLATFIGVNAAVRRRWISAMLEDIDKKNILVVQTLRNMIMGSSLMATTSILLCAGLAAVLSSTYSIKKPLTDTVYGAHGEFTLALKFIIILTIFVLSFFFHTLSIRFMNQASLLISAPLQPLSVLTEQHLVEILDKGCVLNIIGNRVFYLALPLVLWTCGPLLVFLGFGVMVFVLYNLDFVCNKRSSNIKFSNNMNHEIV